MTRCPPSVLAPLLGALAVAASLATAGCETHTCQSACDKVYYQCNGTGMVPVNPTNDAETAYGECVDACVGALYSTSRAARDDGGDGDVGSSYNFEEPSDAMQFIDCVERVDLGNPQCVTDFDSECPWIKW